jgi:hypothetical protein
LKTIFVLAYGENGKAVIVTSLLAFVQLNLIQVLSKATQVNIGILWEFCQAAEICLLYSPRLSVSLTDCVLMTFDAESLIKFDHPLHLNPLTPNN